MYILYAYTVQKSIHKKITLHIQKNSSSGVTRVNMSIYLHCVPRAYPRALRQESWLEESGLYRPASAARSNWQTGTLETIICNVHDYFDQQSKKQKSTPPTCTCTCKLCKKIAEATGISEHTVNCVLLEKTKLDGSSFTSPNKIYKKSKGKLCWLQVKAHIKEHNKKFIYFEGSHLGRFLESRTWKMEN